MPAATEQTVAQIERQAAQAAVERAWPPPQGQWTYEDWLRLPDDGWQYEIIKGVLYMAPAPKPVHQKISRNLEWLMWDFVRQRSLGEVLDAPTDVYLPGQETPVDPDLLFIATERTYLISERGIEGAPDLVVEILSPKSWWRDRRVKLPLYEETGVRECWIIDPKTRTIEVYVLRGQTYELLGQWGSEETARSEVLAGFEVRVEDVMPSPA